VYLLAEDPVEGAHFAQQIERHGYQVRLFETLDALEQAFGRKPPEAIIAELNFTEGNLASVTGVAKLKKKEHPIPILFVSVRMDISARLFARRSGADAYLMKPVDLGALVGRLDELVAPPGENPYRVLLVQADEFTAKVEAEGLEMQGFVTQVVGNPFDLIQGVVEFSPDLILMDLHTPHCNGIELAGILRQEEAFNNIAILFLAAEPSREQQLEALRVGADDLLVRPVAPEWLAEVVRARIRRSRALGWRMHYLERRDPITGFYNRNYFLRRVTAIMRHPPVGLVGVLYLRIDRFAELRPLLGVEVCDRILSELARLLLALRNPHDLLARYSDHVFTFCVVRQGWGEVVELAERCRQAIAGYRDPANAQLALSASVGAGLLMGQELTALMSEVAEAADAAQREGGNRVQLHPNLYILQENEAQRNSYLQQLLENARAGRVHLVYQPIVSVRPDGLERYEALLRVTDANGAALPIRNLISAAEQGGIMARIDRAVLRQALAAARAQIAKGRLSILFVKISAASLDSNALRETVTSNLEQMKLPGETLVLLLPTNAVWRRLEEVKKMPGWLHELGCGLGLEYFGEKMTDIQLLEPLAVDYIKLHPALMRGGEGDEERQLSRPRFILTEAKRREVRSLLGFVEDADIMAKAAKLEPDLIQGNFVQAAEQQMAFHFIPEAQAAQT